jgi:3-isopropylmalate/(R)-2-methylmalate dehydratase large subunit
MGQTLLQKVWDLHTVRTLQTGQTQLFIGLHLIHEVTTPQAFDGLRARGWPVARPDRTFGTVDHIIPTRERTRPFLDVLAEDMIGSLERNCREFGVRLAGLEDDRQGIVHVIGPELGLTQPGMTIACGDSHTSTHGAFGAVAFGIGTSQVRDVLASQCLAMEPLKVRRIEVNGTLPPGVYAKDVILTIIHRLGVSGGVGYAYEYAGDTIERMSMDERMTICNMSIEGGARVGYVNPDQTTFEYLKGRPFAPTGDGWRRRCHRGAGFHGAGGWAANCWAAHRCGVHRFLHQLSPVGPSRSGSGCSWAPRRAACYGTSRTGLSVDQARRRAGRPG